MGIVALRENLSSVECVDFDLASAPAVAAAARFSDEPPLVATVATVVLTLRA